MASIIQLQRSANSVVQIQPYRMEVLTVTACVILGAVIVCIAATRRQRLSGQKGEGNRHDSRSEEQQQPLIDEGNPKVSRAVRAKVKLRDKSLNRKEADATACPPIPPNGLPSQQKEVNQWVPFDLGLPLKDSYDPWNNPQGLSTYSVR